MFLADSVGVNDVYRGSRAAAARRGVHIPANDLTFLNPVMALAAEQLGFGSTGSVILSEL